MMNLDRLYEILRETTVQLRKGEVVTKKQVGPLEVTTIDAMPPVSAAKEDLQLVDLELLVVGVNKVKAADRKDELIEILKEYPRPDELAGGPSYITVGAEIGDQGAAFQLFALGEALELWKVITPTKLGATGDKAAQMAAHGFIMISGFHP